MFNLPLCQIIGTTTQREMRTRKSAEETEQDSRAQLSALLLGYPGRQTFHARFSFSALSRSLSSTREKNLSWNPGYGEVSFRSVRAVITVVPFSFLNLPVSLFLTINRRHLNCCSDSFLSLHDCMIEHIYNNSISCC